MREVKFRGIRLDNGEWVYGDLVKTDHNYYILNTWFIPAVSLPAEKFIEVAPKSVGQLIYVHENNEIYRGDIVRQYNHDADIWTEGELRFYELDMRWELGDCGVPLYKYHNPTVIGNIHENKKD
jgi:hypothetical protein